MHKQRPFFDRISWRQGKEMATNIYWIFNFLTGFNRPTKKEGSEFTRNQILNQIKSQMKRSQSKWWFLK
jgi:hypothetical protein